MTIDTEAIRERWEPAFLVLGVTREAREQIIALCNELDAARENPKCYSEPCYCDPPGSGEEFCRGACFLRADIGFLLDYFFDEDGPRYCDCEGEEGCWHCELLAIRTRHEKEKRDE